VISGYITCDTGMAMRVSSSGQLAGEDFSSTYDCASKSDAIKRTVNSFAAYGCCGGNSNGKQLLFLVVAWFICYLFLYICILTYFFTFYYSKETRNLPAGWITAITATFVKTPTIIFQIICPVVALLAATRGWRLIRLLANRWLAKISVRPTIAPANPMQ
jgi:hypothetical protein